MRIAFTLSLLCSSLAACQQPGTTMQSTSRTEAGESATWAHLANGEAQFECRKSVTGNCHYVLYVEACGENGARGSCATRVVQRFTLAPGQRRELHGLPDDVRACQDHAAMPVAPDCGR